jgi:hypothetical protein
MGLGGWVYDLYVDSYEKLEKMCKEIPQFATSLKLPFYFNRYSSGPNTSGARAHFMRFGVLSQEESSEAPHLKELFEKTKTVLDKAEKEFGAEVKKGPPDFRDIDGMLVDQIKMDSTRVALAFHGLKPTIPQIYLFIHFLMNQLGYCYDEEVKVYSKLVENIAKNMGLKAKIEFEKSGTKEG